MRFKLLILAGLVASFCIGCAALRRQVFNEEVREIPGVPVQTNVVYVTNTVRLPAVTNYVTNTISGEIHAEVQPPVIMERVVTNVQTVLTPPVFITNYVAKPVVRTVTEVGAAAPVPWASTIAAALGLAVGTWQSILNRRNKRKAEVITGTLVDNFEQLRKTALTIPQYRAIDPKVMQVIQDLQRINGVKSEIHEVVEERTSKTLDPMPETMAPPKV